MDGLLDELVTEIFQHLLNSKFWSRALLWRLQLVSKRFQTLAWASVREITIGPYPDPVLAPEELKCLNPTQVTKIKNSDFITKRFIPGLQKLGAAAIERPKWPRLVRSLFLEDRLSAQLLGIHGAVLFINLTSITLPDIFTQSFGHQILHFKDLLILRQLRAYKGPLLDHELQNLPFELKTLKITGLMEPLPSSFGGVDYYWKYILTKIVRFKSLTDLQVPYDIDPTPFPLLEALVVEKLWPTSSLANFGSLKSFHGTSLRKISLGAQLYPNASDWSFLKSAPALPFPSISSLESLTLEGLPLPLEALLPSLPCLRSLNLISYDPGLLLKLSPHLSQMTSLRFSAPDLHPDPDWLEILDHASPSLTRLSLGGSYVAPALLDRHLKRLSNLSRLKLKDSRRDPDKSGKVKEIVRPFFELSRLTFLVHLTLDNYRIEEVNLPSLPTSLKRLKIWSNSSFPVSAEIYLHPLCHLSNLEELELGVYQRIPPSITRDDVKTLASLYPLLTKLHLYRMFEVNERSLEYHWRIFDLNHIDDVRLVPY